MESTWVCDWAENQETLGIKYWRQTATKSHHSLIKHCANESTELVQKQEHAFRQLQYVLRGMINLKVFLDVRSLISEAL